MSNLTWFKRLNFENLLLFIDFCDNTLNIFEVWTIGDKTSTLKLASVTDSYKQII